MSRWASKVLPYRPVYFYRLAQAWKVTAPFIATASGALPRMFTRTVILIFSLVVICGAQVRPPDIEGQRAAMKKLSVFVGRWKGESRVLDASGELRSLVHTEDVRFRLDGLVLEFEGVGRTPDDGRPVLQAIGIYSFDDKTGTYRSRQFNGNGLSNETEVKLLPDGKGMTWDVVVGPVKTSCVARVDENGDFKELCDSTIGSQPPRRSFESNVSLQK